MFSYSADSSSQVSSQIGTPTRTPRMVDRARGRSAREHALFVEHAVIRQIDLEPDRSDAAFVEKRAGIIKLAVVDPGRADQHRRPAVGGFAREFFDRRPARRLERRLQHQVFRRITGDEQFRQHDQVGAVGPRASAGGAHFRGIARDVAHGRIQLGQCDRKLVGAFGHGWIVPCMRANCNRMLR